LEQRRVGGDPAAAVDDPGKSVEGEQAVLGTRLRHSLGHPVAGRLLQPLGDGLHHVDVDPGVPHVDGAHRGEATHPFAVGADGRGDDGPAVPGGESVLPPGDDQAHGQPLEVPLPRPGQRLVEIVDVEHEIAFGRAEQPEVEHVGIAAQLHTEPRSRRVGQIHRHDRGSAPVEPERGLRHPPVPDRDEFRQPGRGLRLDHLDRIAPFR
jgi:hypothetical protein